MNVTFTHLRNYVYAANFEFTNDSATLLEHLNRATWKPNTNGYGQDGFLYREDLVDPDPVLSSVTDYFASYEFKKEIIMKLFESKEFVRAYWPINPIKLMNATNTFAYWIKDQPGHITGIHLDNRLLVASGMCYFIEEDDPNQSTCFYLSEDYENPLRMTTGLAKGWMAANTEKGWHDGWNRSQQDRYSIMYGLSLII